MDVKNIFQGRSKTVLILFTALLIGLGLFTVLNNQKPVSDDEDVGEDGNTTQSFEEYATSEQDTGSKKNPGAEVTSEVTVSEYGVTPTRIEIEVGEGVRWRNSNDFPVHVEFDRTSEVLSLASGESSTMYFRGITDFSVYRSSNNRLIGQGTVFIKE